MGKHVKTLRWDHRLHRVLRLLFKEKSERI